MGEQVGERSAEASTFRHGPHFAVQPLGLGKADPMHFLRRDGERRVPAQLRGIIGVAVGEMPDAGIAVRPARNGAQMIDQMAKTGSETVEQAPLRLANPARSEEHTSELQSLMRNS